MLLTKEQIATFKKLVLTKKIKVVVFDLETSPSKFWGWGTGEQYVDVKMLVQGSETRLITSQHMYSLDKKAIALEWNLSNKGIGDDSEIVKKLVPILNAADIVVGQNSKAFDIKVLQERAKILRLPPVSIDFMLDTLTHSRGSFRSMSHRLDYRSKQYGLGGKNKMEMQDWIDIVEGKTSPKKKMIPYGLKDVLDTDKIFWLELPYYNLPKATVNKILKLIKKCVPEEENTKVSCPVCTVRKTGSKYKVKKTYGRGFRCLICEHRFNV